MTPFRLSSKELLDNLEVTVVFWDEAQSFTRFDFDQGLAYLPDAFHMMAGDHQQLGPIEMQNNPAAEVDGMSVFRKLIKQGFPYLKLSKSYRFHPEICQLLSKR